jgi:hypothetical protein
VTTAFAVLLGLCIPAVLAMWASVLFLITHVARGNVTVILPTEPGGVQHQCNEDCWE